MVYTKTDIHLTVSESGGYLPCHFVVQQISTTFHLHFGKWLLIILLLGSCQSWSCRYGWSTKSTNWRTIWYPGISNNKGLLIKAKTWWRQQGGCGKTKDLMGITIAQHVFFKILFYSLVSSANQYCEITQIDAVW